MMLQNMVNDELEIRHVTSADRPQVLRLAGRSLGWAGDDRDRDYLAWKHEENPAGPSYAIGAFDGDQLVAFRTMLRWKFNGRRAVRAVDTATDPAYQGRGLFRTLTIRAVEDLGREGVDAVFNTPNGQSRPGYLKMGWSELGRPTLLVAPDTPVALARMIRARVPAQKWSELVEIGVPVGDALDDASFELPQRSDVLCTERSLAHLRWRYGFGPLGYRAVEVRGGICIIRVRRRGALREVAFCEWLSPRSDLRAVRRIVRSCGDYGIAIGRPRTGVLPLPRQGPIVVWRPISAKPVPSLRALALSLGDIELL